MDFFIAVFLFFYRFRNLYRPHFKRPADLTENGFAERAAR